MERKTLIPAAAMALAALLPPGAARGGDLAADTVVADRVETLLVGPDAGAGGPVLVRAGAAVAGGLSAGGGVSLMDGVAFLPPLGDVPMGAFTNRPGDAARAPGPAWWAARGVALPGAEANDWAAAVQGQVKWIALQAAAELDAALAFSGGAGAAVSALTATFSPTNNFLPVTLGQLKNAAKPFHDRLMEAGLSAGHPWSGAPADFALANVGQVKALFAFDLSPLDPSLDSDGDGMPDAWEVANGLDPFSGLSGSLVGWWQFREASGDRVADLSGNGNDALILFTNLVSRSAGAPAGHALSFSTNVTGALAAVAGASSGLVLWNRLGSAGEVAGSAVGPGGTVLAGGFVPGVFGNAMEVSVQGTPGATFPVGVLPGAEGCAEFWARVAANSPSIPNGGCVRPVGVMPADGSSCSDMIHFNSNDGSANGGLCLRLANFGSAGTGRYGSWAWADIAGGGSIGEWHHYALVWSTGAIQGVPAGRHMAAYVDGALNTGSWTGAAANPQPLGHSPDMRMALLYLTGNAASRAAVDNLKIWDHAKTDFSDRFTEDAGFTPGNGGLVCVPGVSNLVLGAGFTVAAWARAESHPPDAPVLTRTSDHDLWGDGLSLYHGGSLSFHAGGHGNAIPSGESGTGVWRHVCGVYDGTNAMLYIDGALRGTRAGVAGDVDCGSPLWIGSVFKDGNRLWHGEIADARLYASALSAQEVAGLLEFAADADGDGVSNLGEYLLGTDPRVPEGVDGVFYADSDIGDSRYDGRAGTVLSATRGPKAAAQQAIGAAPSGSVIELRGESAFSDTILSPEGKSLILRPVGNVRF